MSIRIDVVIRLAKLMVRSLIPRQTTDDIPLIMKSKSNDYTRTNSYNTYEPTKEEKNQ